MSKTTESNLCLIFTLSVVAFKFHFQPFLEHLQGQWIYQLPGQPVPKLDNLFHEEILTDVLGQLSAYHKSDTHTSTMHLAITHSACVQQTPKSQQSVTQSVQGTSLHPRPPCTHYKTEMSSSWLIYKQPLPWLRKSGSSLNFVDLIAWDHVNVVLLLFLRLFRKFSGENLHQYSRDNSD